MANKKKNLEAVKDTVLNPGEKILHAVYGAYETTTLGADTAKNGVLVATEDRIIFYAKRLSGYDLENFHYENISTFELSKKLMGNIITFYSSGNKVQLKWISDVELDDFVKYVNSKIKKEKTSRTTEIVQDVKEDDTMENLKQLKLLKELLDMQAITQEEFDKKKSELL